MYETIAVIMEGMYKHFYASGCGTGKKKGDFSVFHGMQFINL
jgi:hypothetical protein